MDFGREWRTERAVSPQWLGRPLRLIGWQPQNPNFLRLLNAQTLTAKVNVGPISNRPWLRLAASSKLRETMVRIRKSDSSPEQADGEPHPRQFLALGRSLTREPFVLFATRLFLACLLISLFPFHLVSQASPEEEAENDIEAAKQAQGQGNYAQAVAGYQAALKLMPAVPELYSNLGIAYYYQKDYGKAIQALQQALMGKPGLEGANLFLGMAYVRSRQFEASIKPLKKAISLNPQLRTAYINLGASYNELGKEEEAIQILQQAEKVFPSDEEVLYSLGSLYYHLMFQTYGKMARVAPNSYRYHQVMGQSFEERQEYPGAIVEFQTALKENPQAPGLHYALGNVYWLEADYADARSEFEKELEISPEDYMSTWKLGNSYLADHQYAKALPYLQEALREKPGFGGPYQDLGKLYLETQDYERALFYLKKVVEMAPNEPSPHYLLSMNYRRLGNAEMARTEMTIFDNLKKDEKERRRPPDAMLAGAGRETETTRPPDETFQPEPH